MVRHQVALDDLALLLLGQRVEDRTRLPTRLAEIGFPSSFGHEHQVILSVVSQLVRFYSHMICPHQLILPEDPLRLAVAGLRFFG